MICVATGVVLLLLIVSILVQVKQPRKKVSQITIKWVASFSQNVGLEIANSIQMFIHTFEVLVRKNNVFQQGDFQEVFDPPHYELFTLRGKVSLIILMPH